MFPYFCVSLVIAILGIVSNKKNQKYFLVIAFLLLAIFAGFRGDFTTDYNNYCQMFDEVNSHDSLWQVWKSDSFATELGFLSAMYLFGRVTDSAELFLCITSVVTVFLFFKEIVRKSPMPWLSILLFVGIDMYYDSFNVTRQVLAAALVFCCTRYLEERSFWKYCLAILAISTIHRTALLMIPMYFLLNIRPTKRNVMIIAAAGACFVVMLPIALMIVKIIYPVYADYTWGMEGGSWKNLVFPAAVALFSVVYLPKHHDIREYGVGAADRRIQVNALIYTIVLTACSMQVYMIIRIAYFFSAYTWILVPNILSQIRNHRDRYLLVLIVAVLAILYPLVVYSNTGYDPYYFIGLDRIFG